MDDTIQVEYVPVPLVRCPSPMYTPEFDQPVSPEMKEEVIEVNKNFLTANSMENVMIADISKQIENLG